MSTTAVSAGAPDAIAAHRLPASAGNATFAGALRSEFTKLRSVRSTYWSLFALVVVTVGIGALASWGATRHPAHGPGFDPTMQSLGGLYLSQLVIGVLGVIVITSEYSTGMIRTTLTTIPRRGTMIAAKATVFAAVTFVTGLITCFASFFLGQALMSSSHMNATLGQPHVLRAVIGGALFLTVCGMLAFGIGLLVRHTAGGISIVVTLMFVLSILVNLLPQSWQNDVVKWVPADAGTQIWTTVANQGTPALFAPWTGFAVFCGYAAIALIAGVILFRQRDA
jgi:ABC-type transport system involved in multi-copper enzyme maturation permease subunit